MMNEEIITINKEYRARTPVNNAFPKDMSPEEVHDIRMRDLLVLSAEWAEYHLQENTNKYELQSLYITPIGCPDLAMRVELKVKIKPISIRCGRV